MKRTFLTGILTTVAAVGAMAQGHILISNYLVPPYNQILWDAAVPTVGGTALTDDSARIQIWYGEGVITDQSQLQSGVSFFVNPALNYDGGAGPSGYYDPQLQVLPTWQPGDVFTFQLRLYWPKPTYEFLVGGSSLWTEQNQIISTSESALLSSISPGAAVWVPEPSTFALAGAGLGAALLGLLRSRRTE